MPQHPIRKSVAVKRETPTPLYGDFDVKNKNVVTSTSFLLSLFHRSELRQRSSFCSAPWGAHPSVPTAGSQARRAQGAVKDGRCPSGSARTTFSGHSLTGPSKTASSVASGDDLKRRGMISSIDFPFSRLPLRDGKQRRRSEASLPGWRAIAPHSLIFGGSERIQTMMRSCPSVGEAPRRQAHSVPRLRSHGGLRVTATSDRCRQVRDCRFEALRVADIPML
jgi:hypothetical protein